LDVLPLPLDQVTVLYCPAALAVPAGTVTFAVTTNRPYAIGPDFLALVRRRAASALLVVGQRHAGQRGEVRQPMALSSGPPGGTSSICPAVMMVPPLSQAMVI